MGAPGGGWSGQPFRVATPAAAAAVAGPLSGPARSGGRSGGGDGQRSLYPPGTSSGNGGVGVGGGGIDGHSQGGNLQSRGPAVSAAQFGGVATPFDANGSSGSAYGGGAPGVGEGGGGGGGVTYGASRYGRGPGAAAPMPPTEQFRAGTGAFGLRKRGGLCFCLSVVEMSGRAARGRGKQVKHKSIRSSSTSSGVRKILSESTPGVYVPWCGV